MIVPRLLTAGLLLVATGCASAPRPEVIIHEGPRGTVYLERVADREFHASHPIKIDPVAVAHILGGLQIAQAKTVLQTLFTGNGKADRIFSEDDVAFLTPLITDALSRAHPDQRVHFQVIHLGSPLWRPEGGGAAVGSSGPTTPGLQRERTGGALYAHGLSLHVTIDEYRHRDIRPDAIGGPNRFYPEQIDLDQHELRFSPASALRPNSFKQPWDSAQHTVVVDYVMAGKAVTTAMTEAPAPSSSLPSASAPAAAPSSSGPAPPPGKVSLSDERASTAVPPVQVEQSRLKKTAAPAPSEEVQALKDLVIKKDMEVEALKKEVKSLKRQLDERDVQLDALRKKIKPTTKSPDFAP